MPYRALTADQIIHEVGGRVEDGGGRIVVECVRRKASHGSARGCVGRSVWYLNIESWSIWHAGMAYAHLCRLGAVPVDGGWLCEGHAREVTSPATGAT